MFLSTLTQKKSNINLSPTSNKAEFTDFDTVDAIIDIEGGGLFAIAGEDESGKTSLALNMAYRFACTSEKAVRIFSPKLFIKEIIFRLSAQAYLKPLEETDIYIDDERSCTVEHIYNQIAKIENLGMLVVDDFEFLKCSSQIGDWTEDRYTIINDLKKFASAYKIPIIICVSSKSKKAARPLNTSLRQDLLPRDAFDEIPILFVSLYGPTITIDTHKKTCSLVCQWDKQHLLFQNIGATKFTNMELGEYKVTYRRTPHSRIEAATFYCYGKNGAVSEVERRFLGEEGVIIEVTKL